VEAKLRAFLQSHCGAAMNRYLNGKNLHELNSTQVANLCANVARNVAADRRQGDTAHALRLEWRRLRFDALNGNKSEVEASLRKRMLELLAEVPSWMLSGV
jgi:hypothetical protein